MKCWSGLQARSWQPGTFPSMGEPKQARGRFAVAVIGAVAGSAFLLVGLLATAPTPQEARAERAAPILPVPTIEVESSSPGGTVAVPRGAIVTDGDGLTFVTVHEGGDTRRVDVRAQGTTGEGLVKVRAENLEVGDQVELVAPADAALPPR